MKQHQPPKLARKIFEWYCGQAKVSDLLGDMDEMFYLNLKNKSAFAARWIYYKQVLSLIFSYTIRQRKQQARISDFASSSFSMAILNNYFKVAARSLYKHKYFSIVNAVGLAIGMSISLLFISLFVYVSTFDNFHKNGANIYRVLTSYNSAEREWELASAPFSIAEKLNLGFSGVKNTVRINSYFSGDAVSGNLEIPMRGFYTEPSFFEVFTFPMIRGNPATALVKPNSIVFSESIAKKVFNSTDILGKTLEVRGLGNFEVTGVMNDAPNNSHMVFDVLVSFSSLPAVQQVYAGNYKDWTKYGQQYVYILLDKELKGSALDQYLATFSQDASKRAEAKINFHLQALDDITPGRDLTTLTGGLGPQWEMSAFIIFGVLALLILLPACFNYTNISIARALKRSKEIGLRKTMGGLRNQIFFQFITETIVITFISLLGAALIFFLVRPEFKNMMVGGWRLDLSLTWQITILFILFALLTGTAAGFFPALHFAGLNPIQALRNQTAKRSSKGRIRKGLTVFQFALSFCFIIALIVFSRQYRYSLNYDFGFHQAGILDVQLQNVNPDRFKNEFSKLASVQEMSMSSDVMGLSYSMDKVASVDSRDSFEVAQIFIDPHYLNILRLKLIAGEDFPNELWQREKYIIVNEEFLKQYNLATPADALGKLFIVNNNEVEIIGVVKNFNYSKLSRPIKAFMFRMDPARFTVANLNVSFTDAFGPMSQMESTWKSIEPDKKFEARFFDDEIRESYDFYEVLLKIVGFLGLLAISISLLGLLGMVVYTAETKVKEVGIRKVMGASTTSITVLLSKDYIKLMLIAAVFAIPFTVAIADFILSNMQHYHVTLNFWDVLLSLTILLMLGLATIASQTFKTASTNPAETLRTE